MLVRLCLCANVLLIAACGQESDSVKGGSASLIEARKLYNSGQFKAARIEIEKAIKSNARASDAHFLAGQIAEKQGDHQSALNEYVAADATGPGSEDGRLAAASLLLRLHAYKVAEEWIARCLADRPADRAMKAYRALLSERLGDSRKARADAEAVLAENKDDPVGNAVLAEEALRRKNPADAMVKVAAGLSKDPSNESLLQLKAEALVLQKLPDQAIEIYQALVEAAPAMPQYRSALAELLDQSSTEQGEQVLRAGVEAAPDNIEMRMRLVAFLAAHRDGKAVIDELRSAIKATPASSAYDTALADVYVRSKDFEAAANVLNDAIARTRSGPANTAAKLALARVWMASGKTLAARDIVDAMLKSNAADDAALAVRGELLLKERNPAVAIQDFLSIAARQPANANVFDLLAEAYLQNDQHKEAVAALTRALSLNPSEFEILRKIVEIQSSFGDMVAAGRTVDDFFRRGFDSVDARALQIRLAVRRKDWISAEAALVHLRQIPGSEQAAVRLDADVKEGQGLHADAANLYRRLVIWNDSSRLDTSAASAFAQSSIAAGQAQQAVDHLSSLSASVVPTDRSTYDLVLASLYDRLDQVDKARAAIDAVIQRSVDLPAPYLQQAAAFARRKQTAEALAFLDRGMAAGASKVPLLLAREGILSGEGRIDDAVLTCRELLRQDPKSAVAANELGNLLADQRPGDKMALQEARELVQRNAIFKNPAILDTLAWLNYRLGDLQQAKSLLKEANADQSSNPQIRFHYGAVLVALGESAEGQRIVKTTLNDVFPGRSEAEKLVRDQASAAEKTLKQ